MLRNKPGPGKKGLLQEDFVAQKPSREAQIHIIPPKVPELDSQLVWVVYPLFRKFRR